MENLGRWLRFWGKGDSKEEFVDVQELWVFDDWDSDVLDLPKGAELGILVLVVLQSSSVSSKMEEFIEDAEELEREFECPEVEYVEEFEEVDT